MPAHSRLKDGVASLAYVAGIQALASKKDVGGRDKPGHDGCASGGIGTRPGMTVESGARIADSRA